MNPCGTLRPQEGVQDVMSVTEAQEWVVRDDQRVMRFTGIKLGEATSRFGHKRRWIEFRLYRTTGGKYVVERIGVSRVAGEVDLYFAQVCESARAVVRTLSAKDNDGAWFLSNVARDLLESAADHDTSISEAYDTEYVE